MDFLVVLVTVPDKNTADKLAGSLLDKRLCACVNLIKGVESFFWWQSKIERTEESLLLIKTRQSLFEPLKKEVARLHPYSLPEIVGFKLTHLSRSYADWLEKETT
jgi:periplasmic divalent cation tolerance protein